MFRKIRLHFLRKKLKQLELELPGLRLHWCGTPFLNCRSKIHKIELKIRRLEYELWR